MLTGRIWTSCPQLSPASFSHPIRGFVHGNMGLGWYRWETVLLFGERSCTFLVFVGGGYLSVFVWVVGSCLAVFGFEVPNIVDNISKNKMPSNVQLNYAMDIKCSTNSSSIIADTSIDRLKCKNNIKP